MQDQTFKRITGEDSRDSVCFPWCTTLEQFLCRTLVSLQCVFVTVAGRYWCIGSVGMSQLEQRCVVTGR